MLILHLPVGNTKNSSSFLKVAKQLFSNLGSVSESSGESAVWVLPQEVMVQQVWGVPWTLHI